MVRPQRTFLAVVVVVGFLATSGCGSGDSVECLSNGVGKVCADNSDGSIRFSGNGLTPDSAVIIDNSDVGTSSYQVGADGSFEPDGAGFLSFVAGTSFTFTISAVDADGSRIEGEIVVTSWRV